MTTATFPEHDDAPINVIRLVRVSGDRQDYERQIDDTDQSAIEKGLRIIKTIGFAGVSGKSMPTNKEMLCILEEVKQPGIAGFLMTEISRFGRPQRGSHFGMVDNLQDCDKTIFTCQNGDFDLGTGEGFDNFVSCFASAGKELREIRRRSLSGKLKNAKRGCLNSGAIPYGYSLVKRDRSDMARGARAHMEPNEVEAAVVKRIFGWAMMGIGAYEIAKRLNLEGVLSKRAGKIDRKERTAEDNGLTKAGKKRGPCAARINSGLWSQRTIWQILTHPAYTGTFSYHKGLPDEIKMSVPAIVEEAVWRDVQLMLPSKKRTHAGRANSRNYELTGLGWCKFCGHRLTTKTRPFPRGYYHCGRTTGKPPLCAACTGPLPYIDKDKLEAVVWAAVWSKLSNEDNLMNMINTAFADQPVDPNAGIEIENARIAVDEAKLYDKRAHDNMRNPRYSHELGLSEWEESQRKLRDAQLRLKQAEQALIPRDGKPAEDSVRALARELAAAEPKGFEERRAFLRAAITEFMTDGTTVEIELSIPANFVGDSHTPSEEKESTNLDSGKYRAPNKCLVNPLRLLPSSNSPLGSPITFTINALLR